MIVKKGRHYKYVYYIECDSKDSTIMLLMVNTNWSPKVMRPVIKRHYYTLLGCGRYDQMEFRKGQRFASVFDLASHEVLKEKDFITALSSKQFEQLIRVRTKEVEQMEKIPKWYEKEFTDRRRAEIETAKQLFAASVKE